MFGTKTAQDTRCEGTREQPDDHNHHIVVEEGIEAQRPTTEPPLPYRSFHNAEPSDIVNARHGNEDT